MKKNINNALNINEADLDSQICEQPSFINYFGRHASELESDAESQKEYVDYISAKLYTKKKKRMISNGEKVTDKALEYKVITSKEYRKEMKKYIDLKRMSKLAAVAFKAIMARGKMLEQLSFNTRKEMDYILSGKIKRNSKKTATLIGGADGEKRKKGKKRKEGKKGKRKED